jgi:hypothetical protein
MDEVLRFLFSPWGWLTLGVVLACLEILLPGAVMLWLAAAALATAGHTALFGLSTGAQLVAFAGWTAVALVISRRVRRKQPIASADETLNRRGEALVGQTARVVQPIVHGRGKVRVGDSDWLAIGPDSAVGVRVEIVSVDGATLRVVPTVEQIPAG